jgi:uncharacterized protein YpiB (UPF0302 family)
MQPETGSNGPVAVAALARTVVEMRPKGEDEMTIADRVDALLQLIDEALDLRDAEREEQPGRTEVAS